MSDIIRQSGYRQDTYREYTNSPFRAIIHQGNPHDQSLTQVLVDDIWRLSVVIWTDTYARTQVRISSQAGDWMAAADGGGPHDMRGKLDLGSSSEGTGFLGCLGKLVSSGSAMR